MGAKGEISQFHIRSFDKLKPSKEQLKTQENEVLKSDKVDFDPTKYRFILLLRH